MKSRTEAGALPAKHSMDATQRGFVLVSAIFLLVVLAGLGVAMITVSTTQHVGAALDIQGTRAYQAARAGIEWGLYRQLVNSQCNAQTSFVLPGTLNAFTVTVSCNATNIGNVNSAFNMHRIVAEACNMPVSGNCPGTSGDKNYVGRRLEVTF